MENNRRNYISMSPAVLKKQINGSLYSVSDDADSIKTQLQTSGTASEYFLLYKRCLPDGDTAPSTASFMFKLLRSGGNAFCPDSLSQI